MTVYCSFCCAPNFRRRHVVAGPEVNGRVSYICNECVIAALSAILDPDPESMIVRLNRWIKDNCND